MHLNKGITLKGEALMMKVIKIVKKRTNIFICFILVVLIITFFYENVLAEPITDEEKDQLNNFIQQIFIKRNNALVTGEEECISSLYDMSTKYGVWAFEHEKIKMKYIQNWEQRQGVEFKQIVPKIVIRSIKKKENVYSVNLMCSTEYKYVYENQPDIENISRIGTYHVLSLSNKDRCFLITKEWYKDPFADSLNLEKLKVDDIKKFITSSEPRDFSSLNERRLGAIEYANAYCGAASEEKYGYKYNKAYKNFNPDGGDCANFASQILHEGGKFKKTSGWNYSKGEATGPWVNADKFKQYMLNSGRASVIAYGSYEKVYKASYKLLPGDFVAYEKKGDITHISMVTGADSKGYSLVTCHNADRNNVPWDLGWSDKNIKFWLIRVHL